MAEVNHLAGKIPGYARRNPGKTAIKYGDKSVSYRELEIESNRIANFLHGKAIKNPHVVIFLDRSPELIISIVAVLKCGLIFVPVDPALSPGRHEKLLAETKAEWVITSQEYREEFREVAAKEGANVLLFDEIAAKRDNLEFEMIYNKYCYIYFTSGSTGIPKGVLGRHKSLVHFIEWEVKEFGVDENFKVSQFTNPSFDPYLRDIFVPLTAGAASCIIKKDILLHPAKLVRWIDRNNINLIHIVPSLFKIMMKEVKDSRCFKDLKYILFAGELLRGNDIRRFVDLFKNRIQLVNLYGPTETTLAKMFYRIGQDDVKRAGIPVGKPIPGAQAMILSPEMKKCLSGNVGEIFIRTPFISSGYFNDSELTKQKFLKNPFTNNPRDIIYRTGDLGRVLPGGDIEILGRADRQVKIRGMRIEPGEIENQLLKYDEVTDAVVAAKEDGRGDKFLCAYLVLDKDKGKDFALSTLKENLTKNLPDYMVPSFFMVLDSIPLNPNGKVERSMLPAPEIESLDAAAGYLPPGDIIERKIADTWKDILSLEKIGVNHNFFDLGGNSLKIMEVSSRLSKEFKREIPIARLFEHTTVNSLAKYLRETEAGENSFKEEDVERRKTNKRRSGSEIAVVGMSCRFPGAGNIAEFWDNLKEGKETTVFFSEEEMLAKGISAGLINDANYVKAAGKISGTKFFDASFFGYTPKEAELLDPQIRIFHECCWEALEEGGIDPAVYSGLIGVYGGAVQNLDWESRALLSGKCRSFGEFAASKLTGIRYLCTRLSYNLNLKGPSVTMQTACSTSLVAVHMACQGLVKGECDAALAGGVTVSHKEKIGYLYQEGMILSPDGHCRAFDARGKGTIFGEGAGVVLLKPLREAVSVGDDIYAVIKGSAINNDGNRKVGFTAPSVSGQVEVIRLALHAAGIKPGSISYIEAHGTATTMGDPIEIEALQQVFNNSGKEKFCKIGSVKSNFGHLDAAAGIAGFIKTVLALKNRMIPPSLFFEEPNPDLKLVDTPFAVNTRLIEWKRGKQPLRAGVSSLGMGGTNAHVILEEAPEREKSSAGRDYHILLLSAKSENSLNMAAKRLAGFLEKNRANNGVNLADAAFTLQTGKKRFNHRRMFTCSNIDEAVETLLLSGSENPVSDYPANVRLTNHTAAKDEEDDQRYVVFMFPGQGAQYVDMGLELWEKEPVFRDEMERCLEILRPLMGYDFKEVLYPGLSRTAARDKEERSATAASRARQTGLKFFAHSSTENINRTEVTQPAVFIFEYALAKLLMNWGIQPQAMIGHSIGEFTAACLAGVLSLEDAVKLVVTRGKIMQKTSGSMLSVPLAEAELEPLLKAEEELALAAVNSTSSCVVSGADEEIEKFAKKLHEKGYESRKLKTSCAFHSKLMEPVLPEFEQAVKEFHFKQPAIPYISNLTGNWVSGKDVKNHRYWSKHLRSTVRFAAGLETLFDFEEKKAVFIEVGPGNALSKFANRHAEKTKDHIVMNLVRHPREEAADVNYLLNKIGQLWLHGLNINWSSFYAKEKRNHVILPTYAFDKKYFWIDDVDIKSFGDRAKEIKKQDISDWFYLPSWKRSVILPENKSRFENTCTLVFTDNCGLSPGIIARIKQNSGEVIEVAAGRDFREVTASSYTLNPGSEEDYEKLFKKLSESKRIPGRIIHMWNVTDNGRSALTLEKTRQAQNSGFYSLINIARASGRAMPDDKIDIIVVADNMFAVNENENLAPEKATIPGPIGVIPQEYPNITCRCVDIVLPGREQVDKDAILDDLYEEVSHKSTDRIIAYRGQGRWVHMLEPVKLSGINPIPALLQPGSVYLITGGLGGIGLVLAEYLAKTVKAKLIITGRSDFPARKERRKWLEQHDPADQVSKKIEILESMEENGAEVLYVQVDVANRQEMAEKIKAAEREFGEIKGIIHSAGIADYAGVIYRRNRKENEEIFAAKVAGTLVLDSILGNRKLDFFVLCSSMSSLCAHFGQVGYSSANAFLDAFARYKTKKDKMFTLSINWDSWQEVGMAVKAAENPGVGQQAVERGMSPAQGVEVFSRALDHNFPNLAVSTIDFAARLELQQVSDKTPSPSPAVERPQISFDFKSANRIEEELVGIWQELLGFDTIDVSDNFFELGGDSLTAVEVRKRIKEAFNIDIPLVKVFHYPTVRSFVKNLIKEYGVRDKDTMSQEKENFDEVKEELSEVMEKFAGI